MMHRLLATAALSGIIAAQVSAADFTIEIRDVRSADGQVYVAVHGPASKATFPSGEGAVAGDRQPAQVGTMRFVVNDLSPGRYAVTAFHDENDNGDLDTNLVGMPTEGYGFSNDARATFGPPKFEAAAVTVGDASEVAVLTLQY